MKTSELKEKTIKERVHDWANSMGDLHRIDCACISFDPDECNCDLFGLYDLLSQYEADIRAKGMLEAYKEVLAFRSPYLYDDYSSLYQYTQELQKEYYEEMGKFLAKKIKELEDKND